MVEAHISQLAGRLRRRLPDDFSSRMFDASWQAFNDPTNPLRLTFFSTGIREMVGHMLHTLAPDESVMACSWFTTEDKTVTRRQRAKYMVQGGLSDDLLMSMNVNMATLYASVRPKIDNLSKHVHVREATAETDPAKIEEIATDTLVFLIELLEAICICRTTVTDALEGAIHEETVMALVTENLDYIDVLSSSHSVETVDVLSKTILSIDNEIVRFKITGEVEADFHWGSSSDGIDGSEAFPFEMTMWSFVEDIGRFEDIEVMVDDTHWQEQFGPDVDC
jgi:hypothetical protein